MKHNTSSSITYSNSKIQYSLDKIDDHMSLENKELFLSIFDRVFNVTVTSVQFEDSIELFEQNVDQIEDDSDDIIDIRSRILN